MSAEVREIPKFPLKSPHQALIMGYSAAFCDLDYTYTPPSSLQCVKRSMAIDILELQPEIVNVPVIVTDFRRGEKMSHRIVNNQQNCPISGQDVEVKSILTA